MEFSRQTYARPNNIAAWTSADLVDPGLYPEERDLLRRLPLTTGQVLLLGVGGGREAIALAKMGFEVTGVDFIPEMVARAKQNATDRGVEIAGLVQHMIKLEAPAETYDLVWLSAAMYSCLPSSQRRISFLQRVNHALRPNGYFVCQFHFDPRLAVRSRTAMFLRRSIAGLTLGNRWYESGDILWGNVEFIHAFSSEAKLRSEFAASGFEVLYLNVPEDGSRVRGEAILNKSKGRQEIAE